MTDCDQEPAQAVATPCWDDQQLADIGGDLPVGEGADEGDDLFVLAEDERGPGMALDGGEIGVGPDADGQAAGF